MLHQSSLLTLKLLIFILCLVEEAASSPKDDKKTSSNHSEQAYYKNLKSSLIINQHGHIQTADMGCYQRSE